MFTASFALAALLGLPPTAAAQRGPDLNKTITTPQPSEGSATAAPRKPVRYCVEYTPTGTRIPRRDCRTRAEWLDYGFDPLAKD